MIIKTPELPHASIDRQLDLLAEELVGAAYIGYPARHNRLVADIDNLGRTAAGALILPDGPWVVPKLHNHAPELPDAASSVHYVHQGYHLDSLRRPLHPWFKRMVEDPELGVLGGTGAYWQWGPNRTADSIVLHGDSVLLIQRNDTGAWAFPGGFIDGDEGAIHAARREVGEETGLKLDGIHGEPVYNGPVVDPRMTAHAWAETSAFMFELDASLARPEVAGGDDARQARWIPLEALDQVRWFGAHRYLAELALGQSVEY